MWLSLVIKRELLCVCCCDITGQTASHAERSQSKPIRSVVIGFIHSKYIVNKIIYLIIRLHCCKRSDSDGSSGNGLGLALH